MKAKSEKKERTIWIYNHFDIVVCFGLVVLTLMAIWSIFVSWDELMLIQTGMKCVYGWDCGVFKSNVCEPVYGINGLAFIGAIVWVGLPLYFMLTKKIRSYKVEVI